MPTAFHGDVVVQHMNEILDARMRFTVESWDQGQVHPGLVNYFEALREKMENSYMIHVGSVSSELCKEYLGMHELLQQLRQQLDITCSESKVELLSKVTEVAKRMTELEERTQKLHADLSGELTKVSRDMPNVVTNLLSSALQRRDEKLDNVAQELDHIKPSIQIEFAEKLEAQKRAIEARANEAVRVEGLRLSPEFNKEVSRYRADYDKDKALLSQQFRDLEYRFNQLQVALQTKKEIETHRQSKIDAQYQTLEKALLAKGTTSEEIVALFNESNPGLRRLEASLSHN